MGTPIKSVMLAAKVPSPLAELRFPLLASPKLDGIRAYVYRGVVYSRKHIAIPSPVVQRRFGREAFNGMDGELVVGDPTEDGCYSRTESLVMSSKRDVGKEEAAQLAFHLFDCYKFYNETFRSRLALVKASATRLSGAVLVPHTECASVQDVERCESHVVMVGYEGLMLRDPDAPYKFGRSTTKQQGLLKMKRFEYGEAAVVGAVELQHNDNDRDARGKRTSHKDGMRPGGKLGALNVVDLVTGVDFDIGTGFTDAQRVELWQLYCKGKLVGRIARYKHVPYGAKVRPRNPVFAGWRDPRDM